MTEPNDADCKEAAALLHLRCCRHRARAHVEHVGGFRARYLKMQICILLADTSAAVLQRLQLRRHHAALALVEVAAVQVERHHKLHGLVAFVLAHRAIDAGKLRRALGTCFQVCPAWADPSTAGLDHASR